MIKSESWLRKTPIAHRGLHSNSSLCPENSMEAFQKAIDRMLPVELDVHLLRDGNVVVFHDNNLFRMTGVDKDIETCRYSDISGLRLLQGNSRIPLFKEVLELVDKRVPILIEIKNSGQTGSIEGEVLKLLNSYSGEFAMQSFNPFSIGWFSRNAPEIIRGQLSGSFKDENMATLKKVILKNLALNCISKPHFISYEVSVLPVKAVDRCRKNGLPVLGWTVRNEKDIENAKLYCDNIIFENFLPSGVNDI